MADKPAAAAASVPRESSWFKATQVAPGTWRIDDRGTVNVYLLIGTRKALLIDTGMGFADLRGYVQSITSLPLLVLNTHWHADHSGADYQFGNILASGADGRIIQSLKEPFGREYAERMKVTSIPEEDRYKGAIYELKPQVVKDGDIIDLGGRRIEVIETPGHTAGELVLLDAGNRILFGGDNDNRLVWLQLEGCEPLETFLASLKKLEKRISEFSLLLPGHGDPADSSLIGDQIRCVESILDGSAQCEPYRVPAGDGLVAKYGNASVVFNPANLRKADPSKKADQ